MPNGDSNFGGWVDFGGGVIPGPFFPPIVRKTGPVRSTVFSRIVQGSAPLLSHALNPYASKMLGIVNRRKAVANIPVKVNAPILSGPGIHQKGKTIPLSRGRPSQVFVRPSSLPVIRPNSPLLVGKAVAGAASGFPIHVGGATITPTSSVGGSGLPGFLVNIPFGRK